MSKFVRILICFSLIFCFIGAEANAASSEATPYFNNAALIDSSFTIIDGEAIALVSYAGYPGITEKAIITTTLQKRNLLFFWSDVTEWVDISFEESAIFEHSYQVKSGTYRVKIRYEISGNGGETDVFEDEIKDSY